MSPANLLNCIALTAWVLININPDCVHSGLIDANNGASHDYCQLEAFNPQCMKNEVIAIEEALYGRHRIGKCISAEESSLVQDNRYFGCYANVTVQMDSKCSGKRQCEVRVPDADLERTRSCLPGLQMFLEVSYSCLEVVEPERSCTVLVTSKQLHLAPTSFNPGGLRCGTKTNPWLLEAPAGQRINISLLDFMPYTSDAIAAGPALTAPRYSSTEDDVRSCLDTNHQYGYLIDKSAETGKRKISICGGSRLGKHNNVCLSSTSAVELVLQNSKEVTGGQPSNFLIRFQAVGCTHLNPPEDAWVKRQDDKITIGCYTSRKTWQLRCQDGRWIGVVSNCNTGVNSSIGIITPMQVAVSSQTQNYEVAVVVAVVFTCVAICLLIMCCGIVGLHRFYAESRSKWSNAYKPTACQDRFEQSNNWSDAKSVNQCS